MADDQAKLFVFAAPSGAGKTTLVRRATENNPALKFSISYTTRPQRSTETDGVDYLFVDKNEFNRLREGGALLEWAEVFDNFYGTSRVQVEEHLADGNSVILEIDWQGAQQVREAMPECVTIFILPPSKEELENRLRSRATDSEEVIARRLRDSLSDMSHWGEFDFVIFNDDLDKAVADLESVLHGTGDKHSTTHLTVQNQAAQLLD